MLEPLLWVLVSGTDTAFSSPSNSAAGVWESILLQLSLGRKQGLRGQQESWGILSIPVGADGARATAGVNGHSHTCCGSNLQAHH